MAQKKTVKKGEPIAQQEVVKANLFSKLESFLSKNAKVVLASAFLLSGLFIFLLFNVKISEANDDALYTEAAYNFAHDFFGHYTPYAPLYPMVLSIVVKLAGINLIALKFTSVLFTFLHLYLLFIVFRNRASHIVTFFVILFAGINCYFLYYSSMTFTEQFFMFLQTVFVLIFFKAYDKADLAKSYLEKLKLWLLPALMLFVLTMARNLAIGIMIPVLVFLVIDKKIIHAAFFIIAFLLFRIPFELFRRTMWGSQDQFAAQASALITQKDPYNPSKGVEDFNGYIGRFFDNYGLYIGKRLYQILGFLPDTDTLVRPGLCFVFLVVFVITSVIILRSKNKLMLFLWLYTCAMVSFTFIALQKSWDQYRLILVFIPFIFILIFWSFYHALKKKSAVSQFLLICCMCILLFSSLFSSINRSFKNYSVLQKNISGDIFYGYTNDWVNYLKMSKWCGDSLPKENLVACRKAPMSFIYANGREFFPIYTVYSTDADSVLSMLQTNHVSHFILASLRRNPKKNDGYVINTLHRMIAPVAKKYPQKFTLVKQIGASEPAYLYKINY